MAEKSSFFDSVNSDRVYFAADWALFLKKFFKNGIFDNGLQVTANDNMTVSVGTGDAFINGYRYTNTSEKILNITNADGVLNRIDNIVVRLDLVNRQITTEVITGEFAENAVAPNLVRTASVYDLRIAKISIPAGSTEITISMIEDTRFSSSDCGNVISAITNPDFNNIYSQFRQQFIEWFDEIKNQLSSDAAGNLQLQINAINNRLYNNTGAHNSIYRGKDITDKWFDGTVSQNISNGSFDDIYIGDYIIGRNTGRKYLVAHINYELGSGYLENTMRHLLMIPEDVITIYNMTNVKYENSYMRSTILNNIKNEIKNDLDKTLLSFSTYLKEVSNGYESEGTFISTSVCVELMNEYMVFGSKINMNIGCGSNIPNNCEVEKTQLAIFNLNPQLIVSRYTQNGERSRIGWWLRNLAKASNWCMVSEKGLASYAENNNQLGVRPYFLIR